MGPSSGLRIGGGLGVGGTIILALVALFFGIDPRIVLDGGRPDGPPVSQAPDGEGAGGSDELRDFVAVVLADTEQTWHGIFQRMGRTYQEPVLVLFSGAVNSACGMAESAVGPFYCPSDHKVYIDLSFYRDLRQRFQAPGDFAQAYVIAHEIGHHVQTLLGISQQVQQVRAGAARVDANALSVRQELQADCLAGIWAHHAQQQRDILEPGDADEALNAASAIGDDRLQTRSRGYVAPDSFTHGSSAQRVHWFQRGFSSGELGACDTFSADRL